MCGAASDAGLVPREGAKTVLIASSRSYHSNIDCFSEPNPDALSYPKRGNPIGRGLTAAVSSLLGRHACLAPVVVPDVVSPWAGAAA